MRRSEQRRAALIARLPIREAEPPPAEPSEREVAAIRRALLELREDEREAVLLVASEGLTAAQLGVVLGVGPVAARARLHRARRRLRTLLLAAPEMSQDEAVGHERFEIATPQEASG
jgi:DNA-directed RNA polymerase specialized sigma24 family protein